MCREGKEYDSWEEKTLLVFYQANLSIDVYISLMMYAVIKSLPRGINIVLNI